MCKHCNHDKAIHGAAGCYIIKKNLEMCSCMVSDRDDDQFVIKAATGTPKPDMVNHPPHYASHPSGVECIDIIEWMPANIAMAMKYLWRFDLKDSPDEDLNKAIWYITRELDRRRKIKESQGESQ